jgi:spore coat protein A
MTATPDPSVYPGTDYYELTMLQRPWQFHRDLGAAAVWGYWAANPRNADKPIGMGYLGPTIETTRNCPAIVKYRNQLPTTHLFQSEVDSMREAADSDPGMDTHELPPDLNVWNVVHLHGGFTPSHFDGMPLQWFTSEGVHGPVYHTLDPEQVEPNEAIYAYNNIHRACMLWYHDHAMGITRLNVYAGLAGAYLVREPSEERFGLPRGEFEVSLVLQDRNFNPDGSLFYSLAALDGADTPVVNGKAYPYLDVEPRRYRLRILNGSNSRFWRLRFDTSKETLPFWLIGTDAACRDPLKLESILIAPSERIDLIVDFSQVKPGTNVTLANVDAPVHYPSGTGPVIPEIMQFRVTKRLSGPDRTTAPDALVLPPVEPIEATPETPRREFVMYQPVVDETLQINALPFHAPNEDFIKPGATEIWEYINPTRDAHPMHVHLVDFRVLNRQPLDAPAYQADYEEWLADGRNPEDKPVLANYLTGPPIPPDPDEVMADKDTVKVYPGMVNRIIQTFNVPPGIPSVPGTGSVLPATYIQHCHILEHEDNDKMRPWEIVEDPADGGL